MIFPAELAKVSFPIDCKNNGLMPKPDGLHSLYGLLPPNWNYAFVRTHTQASEEKKVWSLEKQSRCWELVMENTTKDVR